MATPLGPQCPACLFASITDEVPEPPQGARAFGEYELLEELGRGGMGVVYRAWQPALQRSVAVKMLLAGPFASPEFAARFRREAQAVARLRHPGIAAIYDTGECDGQAFYSMEFVEGRTLAAIVREKLPSPREAADILEKTARAVAHAHAQGVLHRDLKPSNILLDADGSPKVADFGLARFAEGSGDAGLTLSTTMLGSPPYMAPEQAEGRPAVEATDGYGLGAVLYELLTGRPPHQGSSPQEILTHVREAAIVEPRRLNPSLPRDLETICLKCLEREPARRYLSASALADDLGRFLRGEPVLARPVSAAGKMLRWARRNRALAIVSAGLVLTLITGTGTVLYQVWQNAAQARRLAAEEARTAALGRNLRTSLYATDVFAACQALEAGDVAGCRDWLARHAADPARGVEWAWLARASRDQFAAELENHDGYVQKIAVSPDGHWLASAGFDDRLWLHDLHEPRSPRRLLAETFGWTPQFLPDSRSLAFCAGGRLRIIDLASGSMREGPAAQQAALSGDGRFMAIGSAAPVFFSTAAGAVTLLDATSLQPVWHVPGEARVVALDHPGNRVAMADSSGDIRIWNAETREVNVAWQMEQTHSLRFSADGRYVAAAGGSRAGVLPALSGGESPRYFEHPNGHIVTDAAFSPDGARLATSCTDGGVRIFDLRSDAALLTLSGHIRESWTVAWAPDGRRLYSGGKDGRILEWDATSSPQEVTGDADMFCRPLFSPDGSRLLSGRQKGRVYHAAVLDAATGRTLHAFPGGTGPVGWSPDGARVLLSDAAAGEVQWWEPEGTAPVRSVPVSESGRCSQVFQYALSPDATVLAALNDTGELFLYPLEHPAPPRRCVLVPGGKPLAVRTLVWSPDARWIAVGVDEAPYSAWIADTSALTVREFPGHRDLIAGAAFSPDSSLLATATSEGSVLVWNVAAGTLLHRLPGHASSVTDVCFSPDGRTLLSLGQPDAVKFWHTGLWRELATLPLPGTSSHFSIAPDGSRLAISCGPGGKAERVRVIPLR